MANRHAKPHRKAVVGGVYAEWGNSKILNLLGVNYLKDCMQPLPHRPHETAYEVFAGLVRVNRQYAELAPEALKLRLKSLLRILSILYKCISKMMATDLTRMRLLRD